MELKGKVALITGAAVGIGRATAILMAERGASLVLVDLDGIGLDNLKAELGKYNTDILTFVCDVSDERAVYTTVKKTEDHFGKIDVLVNNAALWRCWSSFVETSVDEWKKYLDVNIRSARSPSLRASALYRYV